MARHIGNGRTLRRAVAVALVPALVAAIHAGYPCSAATSALPGAIDAPPALACSGPAGAAAFAVAVCQVWLEMRSAGERAMAAAAEIMDALSSSAARLVEAAGYWVLRAGQWLGATLAGLLAR
jgi:hypothetical protein